VSQVRIDTPPVIGTKDVGELRSSGRENGTLPWANRPLLLKLSKLTSLTQDWDVSPERWRPDLPGRTFRSTLGVRRTAKQSVGFI